MMSDGALFRILSLSGGGVRGIFQAHFLEKLEEELERPICESFDLCAGTSIGSVSAAAIANGISARELVPLFNESVSKVFDGSKLSLWSKAALATGPMFDRAALDTVVENLFKDRTFADAKTHFVCTAGELATFKHRIFSTLDASKHQQRMLVRDAVLASCSAPVFLAPHDLKFENGTFIDGGLWANSPTLVAIQQAHFDLGVPLDRIQVLSVGTGNAPAGAHKTDLEKAKPLSFSTLFTVLNMMSNSQADFFDEASRGLVGTLNFHSVNPILKDQIQLYDYKAASKTLPPLAASEATGVIKSYGRFFGSKEKYEPSGRPSHNPAIFDMIDASGLKRVMPKRSYYSQFRQGSGNIETYLDSATHSIEMISINLSTGLALESITRVFRSKLEQSKEFKVIVSLLDPNMDHLMRTVTSSVSQELIEKSAQEFAEEIRSSLGALLSAKDELSRDCKERFDVRVHPALPQGSAIVLDRGLASSVIQIETKPYKAPMSDSYAIEVQPTGADGLYETFLEAYTSLLNDGRSWSI